MASEYLKWKYRNEKPEERRELTQEEQRKNWWHYHKWHIAIGLVLAGIGANLVWHALGIGQIRPDYQIAYVGENRLPEDTAAAIEGLFASLGEDLNGDGQVVVQLNQYPSNSSVDPNVGMASQTTLMADLLECESYFFLLEDPERFQVNYHALRRLDGTQQEEGEWSAEGTWLAWGDCPALAERSLGGYSEEVLGQTVSGDSDELARGLCLARRGFWTKKTTAHPEGCEALWNRLTEGAIP